MNTSSQAAKQIQQSISQAKQAQKVIDDLIAAHDYQDVASIVVQAAAALLEAAEAFIQSDDRAALAKVEIAEDFLDVMYEIIEGEASDD